VGKHLCQSKLRTEGPELAQDTAAVSLLEGPVSRAAASAVSIWDRLVISFDF
jgi:hypothetical protein